MYQYDRTEAEGAGAGALDKRLLEQLVAPERQAHLLDPRAVHQVERRLRGLGQPPRSATEVAEWLRRLGDLAPSELEGPMAAFLQELEADGRARRIELPRCREPVRWVAAEEEALYRQAFGLDARRAGGGADGGGGDPRPLPGDARPGRAGATCWIAIPSSRNGRSGSWRSGRGRAGRRRCGATTPGRCSGRRRRTWSRCSAAAWRCCAARWSPVRRRSSPTFCCAGRASIPTSARAAAEGLADVLDRLQGLPLPARVVGADGAAGPRAGVISRAGWTNGWRAAPASGSAAGDGRRCLPSWAARRCRQLPPPGGPDLPALGDEALRVLEQLRQRGASFLTDLALETGLSPGAARAALWALARRGLVTNDRFDVARKGEETPAPAVVRRRAHAFPSLRSLHRRAGLSPEGRWSLVPWGRPEPEAHAVAQAALLLHRYGVVARELALLDPWALPWRVLYEVLSRMELAGDVRRGYFVEGLSGAQFALPEAARQLQDLCLPSTAAAPGRAAAQPGPGQPVRRRRPVRRAACSTAACGRCCGGPATG